MRTVSLVCAAAVAFASVAAAQGSSYPKPEIRPFVGAYVPTGNQADIFKSAVVAGAQVALETNDMISLIGNFGWAPTDNKLTVTDQKTNTFMYDVGIEVAKASKLNADWEFKPFFGLGAGARTYDYSDATLSSETGFAGYGALGTEFQLGRTALRVEARDYITNFKHPTTKATSTQNDITFNVGFALHLQ